MVKLLKLIILCFAVTFDVSEAFSFQNVSDYLNFQNYGVKRVLQRSLKTLKFEDGKMTTARIFTTALPQLQCNSNGTAGCPSLIKPKVIECTNKDVFGMSSLLLREDYGLANRGTWYCDCNIKYEYECANLTIACEGYDYDADPYIVEGSCVLEYIINIAQRNYYYNFNNNYNLNNKYDEKPFRTTYSGSTVSSYSSTLPYILMVVFVKIVLIIGYLGMKYSKRRPQPETAPTNEYESLYTTPQAEVPGTATINLWVENGETSNKLDNDLPPAYTTVMNQTNKL